MKHFSPFCNNFVNFLLFVWIYVSYIVATWVSGNFSTIRIYYNLRHSHSVSVFASYSQEFVIILCDFHGTQGHHNWSGSLVCCQEPAYLKLLEAKFCHNIHEAQWGILSCNFDSREDNDRAREDNDLQVHTSVQIPLEDFLNCSIHMPDPGFFLNFAYTDQSGIKKTIPIQHWSWPDPLAVGYGAQFADLRRRALSLLSSHYGGHNILEEAQPLPMPIY